MNILILGGGGREHALAWAIRQNPKCDRLIVAPGNAGIAEVAECASLDICSRSAVAEFAQANAVDLVIVGPEAYLSAGVVDACEALGLPAFGPSAAASRLEADKAWSKAFMVRHGIPTAEHRAYRELAPALADVAGRPLPTVVKDAALRAGKGVTVAATLAEAEAALHAIFAEEGASAVIEDFMTGQEVSVLALTDGERYALAPPSQDHKTIGEGDTGPMTGGMGVICPFPVSAEDLETIRREVIERTLAGLRAEGIVFCGVLYAGLMLTPQGPKVVEFNARFGDPEAEAVLPLLESDLAAHALAAAQGQLNPADVRWRDEASAVIILAAPGYPGTPQKGIPLHLPQPAEGEYIFHAGTAEQGGQLVSSGGRVLAVTATAAELPAALARAYALAGRVGFEGGQLRRDIGGRIGLGPSTLGPSPLGQPQEQP